VVKHLYTLKEVSLELGIGVARLRRNIRDGRLPASKIGGVYMVTPVAMAIFRDEERLSDLPKPAGGPTIRKHATRKGKPA
jgi:hypothetical protein